MTTPLQGDYRGSVTVAGPRVLTFFRGQPGISQLAINCPNCPQYDGLVWGEGTTATSRTEPQPLVHGWYEIQTDVGIFWQQLSPSQVVNGGVDPRRGGRRLWAGACAVFFVTAAQIDGIIAVSYCPEEQPVSCENDHLSVGIVRVCRADTILSMAETGESAQLQSPPPSTFCVE